MSALVTLSGTCCDYFTGRHLLREAARGSWGFELPETLN